jgi:hypothetical protein
VSEAIYLFCFTENADVQNLDEGVFFIDCGEIAALCKRVSVTEFTTEENLQNPEWLVPLVLEHEKVIENVNAEQAVFPAAFGSLFATETSLRKVVEANETVILNFLRETNGLREYSIKGYLLRDQAQEQILRDALQAETAELNQMPAGKRFFAEKKLAERAAQAVNSQVEEICAELAVIIEQNSRQSCERKIVADKAEEREQILNWAVLVDAKQIQKVENICAEYNQKYTAFGLSWQLAGAFPPYSFVPKLDTDAR